MICNYACDGFLHFPLRVVEKHVSTLDLLCPHKNCVQNKMWISIFQIINFKIEMAGKEKTAETQTDDHDKVT